MMGRCFLALEQEKGYAGGKAGTGKAEGMGLGKLI